MLVSGLDSRLLVEQLLTDLLFITNLSTITLHAFLWLNPLYSVYIALKWDFHKTRHFPVSLVFHHECFKCYRVSCTNSTFVANFEEPLTILSDRLYIQCFKCVVNNPERNSILGRETARLEAI